MTVLWTAKDAETATGGKSTCHWQATGVSIDTRSIEPGDLFVALSDVRDGHDFVAQALEKGAAAALVSRVPSDVSEDAPLLVVDNVLPALEAMGRYARAQTSAKVIGITGSVGKTSTKEMLRAILRGQGRVDAAEKSFNNHWGVPLTLARMPAQTDFAVIEMGMNHPGEIAPLTAMARPHVALITNVAAVHLEAFNSVMDIAREKATIFDGLETGGIAILNADLESTDLLIDRAVHQGASPVLFGENAVSDYRLTNVDITDDATIVQGKHQDHTILMKIRSPGRHFAMNALGALAAAVAAGADPAVAAIDLGQWQPPQGRGARETIVLDAVEDHLRLDLLDDAFNANPASMAAAIEVLAASKTTDNLGRVSKGRKVAILGDMLELGADEIALHEDIINYSGIEEISKFHCVGPRMKSFYDLLAPHVRGEWHEDANEMVARAHTLVDAGDVVLVKGSKGSYVSRVVDAIRNLGHPLATLSQGTE